MSDAIRWGRRRLLKLAAWSGLAPLWLAATGVGANEPPKRKSVELPPKSYLPPSPKPPEPGQEPKAPSEAAKELAALARRRYGAHLDEAQMKELTTELDDGLEAGEKLRKVKLTNADEPDFTFRAG